VDKYRCVECKKGFGDGSGEYYKLTNNIYCSLSCYLNKSIMVQKVKKTVKKKKGKNLDAKKD
jgi:hypothetical protein